MLEEELPIEIERARRRPHPICIAIIDIDNFKLFNDTYGHPAGDQLLHEVATAWKTAVRVSDTIARLGGDEFAVLMPDCLEPDAERVLRRFQSVMPLDQTCSIGIASWNGDEGPDALVGRADFALYETKRGAGAAGVGAGSVAGVAQPGPGADQRGWQRR